MRRWWRILAGTLLMAVMLAGNVGVVRAHKWGNYHWNKSGPSIVIQNYIFGTNQTAAEAARQDGWNKIGILYNYRVNYHTDISVFDGNYGATGWAGLASLEDLDWDWGSFWWNHIAHAHARYNTFYGGSQTYVQGVFCQEIGHGWGLDHSSTGDCMGLGYFGGSTSVYGPHNNTDFFGMYRNH